MSSITLHIPTTDVCPDSTTAPQDVPSLYPSPITPINRGIRTFDVHTRNDRTPSRLPNQRELPEREWNGTHSAKGLINNNNTGNGLASPSITPPSAYAKRPQTRHHPPSPWPYPRSVDREAYTAPDAWGVPPISPCASTTHPSTASTVDYLLQSADSTWSRPSAATSPSSAPSVSSSPSSAARSPSPPPPPPTTRRLRFPAQLDPSPTARTTAATELPALRTSVSTSTSPSPSPTPPPTTTNPLSPANALSALPASHALKLSCALTLLALRAHCLREAEVSYRRLLVDRDLAGDANLYSDAETVEDVGEDVGDDEGRRVIGEGSVRVADASKVAQTSSEVVPGSGEGTEAQGPRRQRREMAAAKATAKVKVAGDVDVQRGRADARKRRNVRGRKAGRAARTGKVEVEVEVGVETRRWRAQALGYRRERGRKRAGTGGQGVGWRVVDV